RSFALVDAAFSPVYFSVILEHDQVSAVAAVHFDDARTFLPVPVLDRGIVRTTVRRAGGHRPGTTILLCGPYLPYSHHCFLCGDPYRVPPGIDDLQYLDHGFAGIERIWV